MQAELAGESQAQLPRARQWDALEPSNMLQKVMERVYAVTGHAVYGVGADCCRYTFMSTHFLRKIINLVCCPPVRMHNLQPSLLSWPMKPCHSGDKSYLHGKNE